MSMLSKIILRKLRGSSKNSLCLSDIAHELNDSSDSVRKAARKLAAEGVITLEKGPSSRSPLMLSLVKDESVQEEAVPDFDCWLFTGRWERRVSV